MSGSRVPSRPVVFGEVLFDLFPDGSEVLGGAPFNVAWSLHALGAGPLLISRIGLDPLGARIRSAMEEWGMDLSGLQEDPLHPTGRVTVTLDEKGPGFEIATDQAYDFIEAPPATEPGSVSLLYHGSLALRSVTSRTTLHQLREGSGAPVFLDVNLRSPWWTEDGVREMLRHADEVKLNEDEFHAFSSTRGSDLHAFLTEYRLRRLVITRGERGASLCLANGDSWSIEPRAGCPVLDTVGAGDAFAAVTILGRLLQWQPETTLRRAQDFASAIVGIRGATTTDRAFYEHFRNTWSHE